MCFRNFDGLFHQYGPMGTISIVELYHTIHKPEAFVKWL
jgi:hypothetical protein